MDPKLRSQLEPKLAHLRTEWIQEVKKQRGVDGERLLQKLRQEYQSAKK